MKSETEREGEREKTTFVGKYICTLPTILTTFSPSLQNSERKDVPNILLIDFGCLAWTSLELRLVTPAFSLLLSRLRYSEEKRFIGREMKSETERKRGRREKGERELSIVLPRS